MSQIKENKEMAVLAYDWPGNQGGYRMSCRSCLLAYLRVFPKVHFICIADKPFPDAEQWRDYNVEWVHVPTVTRPLWMRFASSLVSPLPAITMRYIRMSRQMMSAISDKVADCQSRKSNLYIVMQNIPMACFLKPIRKRFPNVRIAVSSHDLCTQSFERFSREGSVLKKLAWRIELAKIRPFERNVCLAADKFWTITDAEAKEYEKSLCVKGNGVFYRGVDTERYAAVPKGDPEVVVHVGSADLKKGVGLTDFIKNVWPHVKEHVPEAQLVLAGRFTERFTNAELGIKGLGFVKDDLDTLGRGRIFLNSQSHGSGLQFKCIVAMLAGKTLLTTSLGIKGIEGSDGEHFFVADTADQMTDRIVVLMNDTALSARVGQAARALTARVRSHEYAARKVVPLVEEFANLESFL
jgi:hypothetical protein